MSSCYLGCFSFYFQTKCRIRIKSLYYVEKIYIFKIFDQTEQSLENRNSLLEPEVGFLVFADVFDLRLPRPEPGPRIATSNLSHFSSMYRNTDH